MGIGFCSENTKTTHTIILLLVQTELNIKEHARTTGIIYFVILVKFKKSSKDIRGCNESRHKPFVELVNMLQIPVLIKLRCRS